MHSPKFQPTRPLRGATCHSRKTAREMHEFQPTRPLRGATPDRRAGPPVLAISTHAPLAGRDLNWAGQNEDEFISTHAPLAGRDSTADKAAMTRLIFQPTRPLRGATIADSVIYSVHGISTHAPLAGRDRFLTGIFHFTQISTHAPLAGRDGPQGEQGPAGPVFQPTRPLRGATHHSV